MSVRGSNSNHSGLFKRMFFGNIDPKRRRPVATNYSGGAPPAPYYPDTTYDGGTHAQGVSPQAQDSGAPQEQPPPYAVENGGELSNMLFLPNDLQFAQMMKDLINFDWKARLLQDETLGPTPAADSMFGNGGGVDKILTSKDIALKKAVESLCSEFLAYNGSQKKLSPTVVFLIQILITERMPGDSEGGNGESAMRLGVLHGALTEKELDTIKSAVTVKGQDTQAQRVKELYPRLMFVMKVLLVHLNGEYDTMHTAKGMKHAIIRVWRDVLGDLDVLRIVILHAHEKGYVDLGGMPQAWPKVIEESLQDVRRGVSGVLAADNAVVALDEQLKGYHEGIEEVHKRYDKYLMQRSLVEAERAHARRLLHSLTDVEEMLKEHDTAVIEQIKGHPPRRANKI
jgi:hypothetical protein